MKIFSSLTNRIFFASAALTVLSISLAVYRVNVAVTEQSGNELRRGLEEAATLLEEYTTTLFEHYSREARLVADLSNLKAAVTTRDPPTVQPIAAEYQRRIGADLFIVTDPSGRVLAEAGRIRMPGTASGARRAIARATSGHEIVSLWSYPGGVAQVVTVPSFYGAELVGTVSVGFSLDADAAARLKALTNSDVVFAMGDRIEATTLPARFNDRLAPFIGTTHIGTIALDDGDYVVLSRRLPRVRSAEAGAADDPAATALILRSVTERLRFLTALHRDLAGTALLAVLAATLLSYAVARSVTRPLGAITAAMREMAATGDLTRRIRVSPDPGWDDEDARLVATSFNMLTESIARFQREESQRERLSSLGRLSTVVAHEIRNPLMIIKTTLRQLKKAPVPEATVQAAVADVEEEVARLNAVVTNVLDFARPIRFEHAPVDLNALCLDALRASAADGAHYATDLDLQPAVGTIVTDGERLRLTLVNILANARHALHVRADGGGDGAGIRLATSRDGDDRILIEISDAGVGIDPADLARVFDPFFTTRRTGTGLGLAISRNIIEGLGGSISVASRPGEGSSVRIVLPRAPR